ncbi:MAG: prepilin-type N-terminal cleavage/methylation domain-containing protein [Terriglobales bacterium]|jgi:prepilin-type N-terminal cleavage/methylation domain-containing protein
MKSLKSNARHRASGFSLIEMLTVVAIIIVMASVTFMSLIPVLNQERVTNAYNTTLSALRQARDCSVAQRTSYSVSFSTSTPNSIAVAATTPFAGDPCTSTFQLPTNVIFLAPPAGATPPDGYGTGANAIDFGYTPSSNAGGGTTLYFCPDGSAQTASGCFGSGNWDGGVVYLARTGDTGSYRAVDLWGATGRVHGWRLYPKTGGYQWLRQ